MTLGRMSSPESVVRSCDARVKGISSKMESFSTLAEQLQSRMAAGEAEYRSGFSKLRCAACTVKHVHCASQNISAIARATFQVCSH